MTGAPDGPAAATDLTPADRARVRELLGREPQGRYEIVVRDDTGDPVVLRNAPFMDDGTPMPTRYWLIGPDEIRRIGRLESEGGVDAAEAAIDPGELAFAHTRYAAERDAEIPADHTGPRPSGGVGGTRTGVKCLHAHWAWHLADGDDPVGRWIAQRLRSLQVEIGDDELVVTLPGGERRIVPWGPANLTATWLVDGDPPLPASLTNALGAVDDHIDDLDREHGTLDGAPTTFAGVTVAALAGLELGTTDLPFEITFPRGAAEEVFRLVATESATDRAHNPGLPFDAVDRIVATCCIVLAVMRRLHLDSVILRTGTAAGA